MASVALLLFIAAMWFSVFSIRSAMDAEAFRESRKLMEGRISAVQEQVALIASDYHNWTDVYQAAEEVDIEKLASNYGITAARGDVFEYAAMYDGPFDQPVAWVSGQGLAPQAIFFATSTMDALRVEVSDLRTEDRETYDFFLALDGNLVMFSSSYLLPEDTSLLGEINVNDLAIASIGKILSRDRLQQIEKELSVSSLGYSFESAPEGLPSLSLRGPSGETVAFLFWDPPKPGTNLFDKMLTILIGVTIAFAAITLLGTRLVHANARALMRKESEAADLARTDVLTGLPNRLALLEHLRTLADRHRGEYAILALDLNRFKQVNDVIGHDGGDRFLKAFAERVRALLDEQTFVARNGGDEFVAVFWHDNNILETVQTKIENLNDTLSEPIRVGGFLFDFSVSRGLAVSRNGDHSPEELLRRADRAMYHAKAHQCEDVVWYDREMQASDLGDNRIEKALRSALVKGDEFSVAYQPIVNASDNRKLVRVEALARWHSRALGSVSPGDFIRIAEATGLIIPLGWIMLDKVCEDLRQNPGLEVAINVSPMQVMIPGFAVEFCSRVLKNNIDCERIEVEITENVAFQDDEAVSRQLHILRSAGFSVALDDFGTGFSSLGYLWRMPFNSLKIDRSFVSGSLGSESFRMINTMVSLAHSMGMTVVAEGVEHEDEIAKLRQYECDFIQGYLIGKPAPLSNVLTQFNPGADLGHA
ncbi:bifunctional diguanylate cyclase/phosphodiesterase [Rhodovulum sp. P5]|uniref:putative bifunctional diguanylate cyclase/phosphodiesterase n=1 Tax=Rhodovulum sp. P5 TaxID=1564506 RepID=UPI001C12B003|nr:bifunctional diguanylate cyclase/phosphodiesterase [Rhodovulum sp. P5]